MDSKMRSGRSVFRNVFVFICLFIPFLMITVLKNAVVYLKRKVYNFFQSKLKKFNEIHGDNAAPRQRTDCAFIEYTNSEDQVPGKGYRQKATETDKARRFQKTVQQTSKRTYKIKKTKSTDKKRNQRKIKIQPPPVEELVLKGSIDSIRAPVSPSPNSTPDVPGQVPANISVQTTLAGDRNICYCKRSSVSKESKRRSSFYFYFLRIVNAMVDVPRKIYAYAQRELERFNDIHQDSMEVLPYTEPAFIAYLKGEEAAPFIESPHIRFSTLGSKDLTSSPLWSLCSLEKETSSALPTDGQRAQAKREFTEWKENGEMKTHLATPSENDFATKKPATEKRAKPKVKSHFISSAHTDVCTPTSSLDEKAKGKDIPSPLRYIRHEIRAPSKAKDQEHSTSEVTPSSQANVTGKSQGIASRETNGISSAKEQIVLVPNTARVKQAENEEEFEQISCWDGHALDTWTQNMLSASREVFLNIIVASNITGKRDAEGSAYVNSKAATTEFVGRQTHRFVRQSEQAIAEEPPFIEVVKTAPSAECLSTDHSEVIKTDRKQCAATISSDEPVEAKQQSEIASESYVELMEPMELDQEQCQNEIFLGNVQTQAIKANQESATADDNSVGLRANFVQPFSAPSTEEMMETDQEPLLPTSFHAHPLETMESTHKLDVACTPAAIPVEAESDAKRPSSSIMGVLEEKRMIMKTSIAEQRLTQTVMKPGTACMTLGTEQCCMRLHQDSIYNEHPQAMECEPLNNNQCFGLSKQQNSTVAKSDHSKSRNQPTVEQQQLGSEIFHYSDNFDSDSDDDSYAEYDRLGLGEQVLLIINLLA